MEDLPHMTALGDMDKRGHFVPSLCYLTDSFPVRKGLTITLSPHNLTTPSAFAPSIMAAPPIPFWHRGTLSGLANGIVASTSDILPAVG